MYLTLLETFTICGRRYCTFTMNIIFCRAILLFLILLLKMITGHSTVFCWFGLTQVWSGGLVWSGSGNVEQSGAAPVAH